MTQENYCRDKAAPPGSTLYYATLFEPVQRRNALFALFALYYEIIECLTASPDPGVSRLKLEWWHDEIERLSRNQSRHPVTKELQSVISDHKLEFHALARHLQTVNTILDGRPLSSIEEWLDFYAGGLGQIWYCAARLSACEEEKTLEAATHQGGLVFILELLQNPKLYSAGHIQFLPDELFTRHKLSRLQFISPDYRESARLLFTGILDRFSSEFNTHYDTLRGRSGKMPLFILIINRITLALCDEIRRDGYQLLTHKIVLTPVRKLWIAYRTKILSRR